MAIPFATSHISSKIGRGKWWILYQEVVLEEGVGTALSSLKQKILLGTGAHVMDFM